MRAGPTAFEGTIVYVRAILEVRQLSKPLEGTSDDYYFGMSLIHKWISHALESVSELPDVKDVISVTEEA